MESARDPEVGYESIEKDHAPNSQRFDFQYSETLNVPLLWSDGSFADDEGTSHKLPDDIRGILPKDVYMPLSSDGPHAQEVKTELRQWVCRVSLDRERIFAHDKILVRMSHGVTMVSAYHLAFMGVMCVAVYGGFVDGKPWSVVFWLMLVELAVLLTVLALKMASIYEFDNRKQPETVSPKLNLENMPALRVRLGEQEFKNVTETLQKQLDQIWACLVEKTVVLSFWDVVKSYFKRQV